MVTTGHPTLPVARILDLNPTRIREDLGDLTALQASIQANGLKMPVLLTPDWELVDGARRLAVFQGLKKTTIPVTITHDWDTTKAYFAEAKRLAQLGLELQPMTWLQYSDLWGGILTRLYAPERTRRMVETRRVRTANGTLGTKTRTDHSATNFVDDLAAMSPYSSSEIKAIRDIASGVRHMYTIRRQTNGGQKAGDLVSDLVNQFNQFMVTHTNDPWTSSGSGWLRRKTQDLAAGRMELQTFTDAINEFIRNEGVRKLHKQYPTTERAERLLRTAVVDTTTTAGRLVDNIRLLSVEAEHFDFDLEDMSPDVAEQLARSIATSVTKFNRLKRAFLRRSNESDPTNHPTNP